MKKTVLFFTLFCCVFSLFGQDNFNDVLRWKLRQYSKAAPGYLVAGMADGLNQTLWAGYGRFKREHPKANDNYWNPYKSFVNKYDHGFLGQTAFVWITDAHHLTRTVSRTSIRFNTMVFPVSKPGQKWGWYVADFMYLFLVESIGFHSTYSFIYKK